jgi:hypothetical protein
MTILEVLLFMVYPCGTVHAGLYLQDYPTWTNRIFYDLLYKFHQLVLTVDLEADGLGERVANAVFGGAGVLALVTQPHTPEDKAAVAQQLQIFRTPGRGPGHHEGGLLPPCGQAFN